MYANHAALLVDMKAVGDTLEENYYKYTRLRPDCGGAITQKL